MAGVFFNGGGAFFNHTIKRRNAGKRGAGMIISMTSERTRELYSFEHATGGCVFVSER